MNDSRMNRDVLPCEGWAEHDYTEDDIVEVPLPEDIETTSEDDVEWIDDDWPIIGPYEGTR